MAPGDIRARRCDGFHSNSAPGAADHRLVTAPGRPQLRRDAMTGVSRPNIEDLEHSRPRELAAAEAEAATGRGRGERQAGAAFLRAGPIDGVLPGPEGSKPGGAGDG